MTPEMKLREAVRASAAPVPEDFLWRMEQTIDCLPGKERPVMKKKMSAAVVLAIALCLLAAGALAAVLLSSKELVEQHVVPMALENDAEGVNDTFTNEQLARIVALAEENDIRLSDSILRALEKGEGYWEEEVIISLAKSQFGPYPGQWTIEEQYWFGEMCTAIGYQDSSSYHLPSEGDMTYEEAYAKAREHVAAQGHDVSLLDDRTKYALSRSCIADKNKNGDILCVTWSFWFEPLDANLPSFDLQMNADGSLAMFRHNAGLSEKLNAGTLQCHEVQDYFSDIYGNQNKWTPEIFVEYVTVLRQTDLTNASRGIRAYAATNFCLPPEGALTAEEAIAAAKAALAMEDAIARGAYCFEVEGRICWKVTMRQEDQFTSHMVEMDAITGEILLTYEEDRGHVAQYFVPLSVWQATPEPEPDGLG